MKSIVVNLYVFNLYFMTAHRNDLLAVVFSISKNIAISKKNQITDKCSSKLCVQTVIWCLKRIYKSFEMANRINTSLQNVCGMFSTKFIQIRYREEMNIGIILCQDLI